MAIPGEDSAASVEARSCRGDLPACTWYAGCERPSVPGLPVNVRIAVAIAVLVASWPGAELDAQRVTGRVVEAGSGNRVAFAQVALVDDGGAVVRTTASDSAGYFVLEAARPGTYRLRAVRIGYADYTSANIELRAAETITVVIRLAARGIPLEPLEVRARGLYERGRDGFERRRALGRGVFLTVDSIWLREPRLVSDAFYGIPGIQVFEGMGDVVVFPMTGAKCFMFFIDHIGRSWHAGEMPDLRRPLPVPSDLAPQGPLNQRLKVEWIQGIEIYRDFSEMPRELRTALNASQLWNRTRREYCGMIWIWTNAGW